MLSAAEAVAFAERARRAGRTIVFTSGVFDLLHPGHVSHVQAARGLGDVLIVGVKSDRSVQQGEGSARAITPEGERAEILEALASVDATVLVDEETAADLISRLAPDVLVTGNSSAATAARHSVEARGGRVAALALDEGGWTTSIVKKIQKKP
jgi:rfaE bifunctional protein nucleotidyltransferase chain/domain